ncbi:MAG TPA: PEP-CTERM sorting domain-containing protein [Sedimentisphaerales bacterium]|nr:PEP-CTERM sorting domain-containing protein [Sedimentisphaerales bacterium]
MSKLIRSGFSAMLLTMLTLGVSSAAIVPITSVQAGVNKKAPYVLHSLTVGDFTITREFLALGKSTGSALLLSTIRYVDDFNLNSVATRNASGVWKVTKIGGLDTYTDTNGDAPDFFLFEAGMNDPLNVQAILADGTLGKTVTIPCTQWGYTGLNRVGILNGGQPIGGVAFAITDLLDTQGQPLAPNAAIQGLLFRSPHVDPVHFSAAMMIPEPATVAILALGGLLAIRRRR